MKIEFLKTSFLITALFLVLIGRTQVSVNDSSLSIPMFYASYSFQAPGGDMADRFGLNSSVGAGFQWKTPGNWMFGTEFNFIFGGDVKNADSLLTNLTTQTGHIIDQTGNFTEFSLFERGYSITAKFSKLFPVFSPNPNSGIFISGSAGYLQHKIRIEVFNNTAPQLRDDYKKGYDRLTGGFVVNEFIGYMYLSENRLLNFYAGFEFTQAWTKPFRDINFDTMKKDEITNRFDMLNGFKIGWIIPVFQRQPEKFYYY